MTKEELRKEFYRKFTSNTGDGYRMDTSVAVPPRVLDFFWERLEEKEELLKAAEEVINQCAVGFSGYKEALEKYEKLKK